MLGKLFLVFVEHGISDNFYDRKFLPVSNLLGDAVSIGSDRDYFYLTVRVIAIRHCFPINNLLDNVIIDRFCQLVSLRLVVNPLFFRFLAHLL